MKTTNFLAIFLLLASAVCTQAQEKKLSVEARAGINFSEVHLDGDSDGKFGERFEIIVDKPLSSSLFLRLGLTFTEKPVDISIHRTGDFDNNGYLDAFGLEGKVRNRYLQIPLMLGYDVKLKNISLKPALGGYFAYGLYGTTRTTWIYYNDIGPIGGYENGQSNIDDDISSNYFYLSEDKTFKDIYKHFDSGLIASVSIDVKRVTLNAGYEFGLVNFGRNDFSYHNRTSFFSLGYKISK